MVVADFSQWVTPDLILPVRGHTFPVSPPTVEEAKVIAALAVRAEIELGLVQGVLPDEVKEIIAAIPPAEHPALREAYPAMRAANIPESDIYRAGYYAVFFWARGGDYADRLAKLLWSPRETVTPGGDASPKDSSPRRTGRPSASVNPTRTAGTRNTKRSRKNSNRKRRGQQRRPGR